MSYDARSTRATNASATTPAAASFVVRYRTSTKPRSPLSTNESRGALSWSIRTWMVDSLNWPEKTRPVYRTVANRTAESLRCQLRSRNCMSAPCGSAVGRGRDDTGIRIDGLVLLRFTLADLPAPFERTPEERHRPTRGLRANQVEDAPAQVLLGEVALDAAADHERDGAGLLAHDHDHGIGLLADADGRAVSGSVALRVHHVL